MPTSIEISKRFQHHPPSEWASDRAAVLAIRRITGDAAVAVNAMLPESREKSLALTAMEESLMWALKAVQLHHANLED